jgi:hypothetical protein
MDTLSRPARKTRPGEGYAGAQILFMAPKRHLAITTAGEVTRKLCGRSVTLRCGSKLWYLQTNGGVREIRRGFQDGIGAQDPAAYVEMLQEAEKDFLCLLEESLSSPGR